MIADVQISRIHKHSPYNVSEFVPNVTGTNEDEIFNSPQIQELINKTFGNKLRVSIMPIGKAGQKDFIVNREPKKNRQQIAMNELIKITEQNGNRAVSARELHKFLEVKTDFKDWMPRMLEYGFEEGNDFSSFLSESTGGRPSKEYALTIDTAKEIAMLQRTAKGKEARQYFIAMEKEALNKMINANYLQRVDKNNVSVKRLELINEIRNYLRWGDMHQVALELKIQDSHVKKVISGKGFNTASTDNVVKALYNKAVANKETVLFSYQEMIDTLNN
jgi:phage anti-repressor protein